MKQVLIFLALLSACGALLLAEAPGGGTGSHFMIWPVGHFSSDQYDPHRNIMYRFCISRHWTVDSPATAWCEQNYYRLVRVDWVRGKGWTMPNLQECPIYFSTPSVGCADYPQVPIPKELQ